MYLCVCVCVCVCVCARVRACGLLNDKDSGSCCSASHVRVINKTLKDVEGNGSWPELWYYPDI